MEQRHRTQLALGIILVLAAIWLIASRIFHWEIGLTFSPAIWVMLSGALILLIGLLVGAPGMAIPACIVAGIGGILYLQETSIGYGSWSYAWTLIPGFIGVGILLSGLLGGNFRKTAGDGLNALVVSVVLFAIFGSMFGGWTIFGNFSGYAPIILLFLLGLWLIIRGLIRRSAK